MEDTKNILKGIFTFLYRIILLSMPFILPSSLVLLTGAYNSPGMILFVPGMAILLTFHLAASMYRIYFVPEAKVEGEESLINAAATQNLEAVRALVPVYKERGDLNLLDRHQRTALWHAISNGNVKITDLLLRAGADLRLCTSEFYSKGYRRSLLGEPNYPGGNWDSAIVSAARNSHAKIFKYLFKKGYNCDINDTDSEALSIAVRNQRYKTIEYFVKFNVGFNVDVVCNNISFAIANNDVRALELLYSFNYPSIRLIDIYFWQQRGFFGSCVYDAVRLDHIDVLRFYEGLKKTIVVEIDKDNLPREVGHLYQCFHPQNQFILPLTSVALNNQNIEMIELLYKAGAGLTSNAEFIRLCNFLLENNAIGTLKVIIQKAAKEVHNSWFGMSDYATHCKILKTDLHPKAVNYGYNDLVGELEHNGILGGKYYGPGPSTNGALTKAAVRI